MPASVAKQAKVCRRPSVKTMLSVTGYVHCHVNIRPSQVKQRKMQTS
nr:hypothetical protein [Rhodopirellula sp. SWK7]